MKHDRMAHQAAQRRSRPVCMSSAHNKNARSAERSGHLARLIAVRR